MDIEVIKRHILKIKQRMEDEAVRAVDNNALEQAAARLFVGAAIVTLLEEPGKLEYVAAKTQETFGSKNL